MACSVAPRRCVPRRCRLGFPRTCAGAGRRVQSTHAPGGHDASLIWEGHKAGRDIGYCHLEKLHNLEALPADGFFISCFPPKIRGASAGWTRAVAIFDEALLPPAR
jgi:kynurenine formamidase